MILIYGIIALGITFVAYFWIVFLRHSWLLRKFRGPCAFPLMGNCYDPDVLKSVLKYFAKTRKKYGNVFKFFSFTQGRLIVLDPIVARRILSDVKCFPKGTDYTHTFSYVFGKGLVTSSGDKHKADRSLFGRFFVRTNLIKQSGAFNRIIDHAIDELLRGTSSLSVNVEHFFAVCALRLFSNFFSGADSSQFPARERVICDLVSKGSNTIGLLILFSLPPYSFLPQVNTLNQVKKEMQKELSIVLLKRRSEHAEGLQLDAEDCLNAMLKEQMSEADMLEHYITLISAGHDTTAYFSSYLIYLLSSHPTVQDKLRAEVLSHFQGRTEVTPDDVVQLTYLTMVMQETLRFYAIIPILTRTSAEEVYIKEANCTIPKGVGILVPLAIMNRDPAIWKNPNMFEPERFGGKVSDFTSARNGYFPFGYGSRTCIGNTLAQIESTHRTRTQDEKI